MVLPWAATKTEALEGAADIDPVAVADWQQSHANAKAMGRTPDVSTLTPHPT